MPPTVLRPDPNQAKLEIGAFVLMSLGALYFAFTMPHGEGELIYRLLVGFSGAVGLILALITLRRMATGGMRIELHDDALIYCNPAPQRIDRADIIEAIVETERDSDGVTHLIAIRHREGGKGEWSPVEKIVLPFGSLWDHAATVNAINRWLKAPAASRDTGASGTRWNFDNAMPAKPMSPPPKPTKGFPGRRHFGLRA